MTTDSYYAIGKSHMVCQDVARHGGDRSPFIIVCDGCSGSPQTELGAAVLAQTISTLLQPPILSAHRRVQAFGPPAVFAAAYSCDSLRVPRAALDATLMLAIQTDTHVQAGIWGDGAIMWRQRSGRRVLVSIEFKHGAPAYLSYRLDAKRLAGYREQTEDGLRTITTYEDAGDGFKLSALYEDTGMEPFTLDFPIEDVDLVLLASDGLGSFQRRVDSHFEAVPICRLDRRDIGVGEILLAEMHEIGPDVDRRAPMIIDDQAAIVGDAQLERLGDLAADLAGVVAFVAELQRPHAERHQAARPGRIGHDWIEDVEKRGHIREHSAT